MKPSDVRRSSSTINVEDDESHRIRVSPGSTDDASNAGGSQIALSALISNCCLMRRTSRIAGWFFGRVPSASLNDPPEDQIRPSNVSSDVSRQYDGRFERTL